MPVLDTTGMLCTCGKKLIYTGVDNGCHVLVCPVHSKKSYRIPMNDPKALMFPIEGLSGWGANAREEVNGRHTSSTCHLVPCCVTLPNNPKRIIYCKVCSSQITEEQALRTFEEEGRALCLVCEGREHGIEVMGFERA